MSEFVFNKWSAAACRQSFIARGSPVPAFRGTPGFFSRTPSVGFEQEGGKLI